nr:MAG TPA: Minor tail protein U Alpha-Beta fold, VIRAL PROTEIN [Caudoviricetes sp.]
MKSICELLYLASVAALQGMEGALAVHDRTRIAKFTEPELPCVRVLEGADRLSDSLGDGSDVRELELTVELYVRGEQLGDVDGMRLAVINRLLSDISIINLADRVIVNDRAEPERSEADGLKARISQHFRFQYRVASHDLTLHF